MIVYSEQLMRAAQVYETCSFRDRVHSVAKGSLCIKGLIRKIAMLHIKCEENNATKI